MTDNEIIQEATEATEKNLNAGCYVGDLLRIVKEQQAEKERLEYVLMAVMHSVDKWLEGDELKQDEANRACTMREKTLQIMEQQQAEIERLQKAIKVQGIMIEQQDYKIKSAKSEAIKEVSEKITEIFMRYAHLHHYAEGARKDFIEAVDGTEIEMQSVWDVFTLKKNEMSEYEEMSRLQENIETIAKERLLTELEKDFRLLVKEMTNNTFTKIEHNSLCETETYRKGGE